VNSYTLPRLWSLCCTITARNKASRMESVQQRSGQGSNR